LRLPDIAGQVVEFDGEYMKGEEGFNPAFSHKYRVEVGRRSITRIPSEMFHNFSELSLDCSEIYPSRVGTVSQRIIKGNGGSGTLYDVVDDTIPANLDYSKQIIAGETMTIVFQSGNLAGREFDVRYVHNDKYDNDGTVTPGKRFEIVSQEIDGITMPSGNFEPEVGDKYAIFNITLPKEYIDDPVTRTGASWDMLRKALKYLYDNEQYKFAYRGDLDRIWVNDNYVNIHHKIRIGGYVQFHDTRFQAEPILIRIMGYRQNVNYPQDIRIELSNETWKPAKIVVRENGGKQNNAMASIYQPKTVANRARQVLQQDINYAKKRIKELNDIINAMGSS
jgi:hypothetical protein